MDELVSSSDIDCPGLGEIGRAFCTPPFARGPGSWGVMGTLLPTRPHRGPVEGPAQVCYSVPLGSR
eukprot:4012585-Lingulodinium_polyedra.AAC.1